MSTSHESAAADRRRTLHESLLVTTNDIDTITVAVEQLGKAMQGMWEAATELTKAQDDTVKAMEALAPQDDKEGTV